MLRLVLPLPSSLDPDLEPGGLCQFPQHLLPFYISDAITSLAQFSFLPQTHGKKVTLVTGTQEGF